MKTNAHRKRLSLVMLGFIVAIAISWSFAFRKTIMAHGEYKKLQSGISEAEFSIKTINKLTNELNEISLLQNTGKDFANMNIIFKRVSDLSEKQKDLRIVSFPEIHSCQFKKYHIKTLEVELEGPYESHLKLIKELETEKSIGILVSTTFSVKKDLRNNKENLRLKVYIQNTRKILTANETRDG